jgi:hypothetical protein
MSVLDEIEGLQDKIDELDSDEGRGDSANPIDEQRAP